MSNPNYTLEIVSHHPKFNNKSLRKYYVAGIETVGVWGDEPFEIRFKNNTFQKVQVKLTLDGTDILTGKPADTNPSKDMWVVNGYGTLSLKAWPEDNNGGAAFVFTNAGNSVAVHTHGDLSSRGIIAAAVFTEGHVEPIRYNPPIVIKEEHHHHDTYPYNPYPYYPYYPIWINTTGGNTGGLRGNITYTSNGIGSGGLSGNSGTFSCNNSGSLGVNDCYISDSDAPSAAGGAETIGGSLDSLVAVGAGQHVDQKITYVAGLIKPLFTETVRVKYLWWDSLVEKLRAETPAQAQPSGFPGDSKQKNIDLQGTPRLGEKKGSFRRAEVAQSVFDRF